METLTKIIEANLDIYVLMSNYNISPKIIEIDDDEITMEKYDGDLKFLYKFYKQFPQELEHKITKLIDSMHGLDIAHGDLHPGNIVYKIVDDEIIFRIIDFDYSFHISSGKKDKNVTKYRKENFDPEVSENYEDFVKYDYTNWKDYFSSNEFISFKGITQFINDNKDSLALVMLLLAKKFNLKLFGVYLVNKTEITIDKDDSDYWKDAEYLALKLPSNDYYIGINIPNFNEEIYTMLEIRTYNLMTNNTPKGKNYSHGVNNSANETLFDEIDINSILKNESNSDLMKKIKKLINEFASNLDF